MSKNSNGAVGPPELYRKWRPKAFKQVFGQPEAVKQLRHLLDDKRLPHAIMFIGPSGVGKTTIARILKHKLNCSDQDYQEVNCAVVDGAIETIREIQSRMGLAPWNGSCRIWLLDEVQSLSRAGFAQQALLKMLEDTPRHVYFFLATTNPEKVIPTIHTRCHKIVLRSLTPEALRNTIDFVCEKEGKSLSEKVRDRIVEVAEGSGRNALVQLHKVIELETEQEQLDAVQRPETVDKAFNLARMLIWQKGKWPEVVELINSIGDGEDWEAFRYLVLACATKEMLKNNEKTRERARNLIYEFRHPFYDTKRAGLVLACHDFFWAV